MAFADIISLNSEVFCEISSILFVSIFVFKPSFISFKLGLNNVQFLYARKFCFFGSTIVGMFFLFARVMIFSIILSVNTPLL